LIVISLTASVHTGGQNIKLTPAINSSSPVVHYPTSQLLSVAANTAHIPDSNMHPHPGSYSNSAFHPLFSSTFSVVGENLLHSIHSKNHMPQELHHPPTLRIALSRFHNPPPEAPIIAPRPLQHPIPTHRKLRTARRAYLLRDKPHIIPMRELRY